MNLLLALALLSFARADNPAPAFPDACRRECESPFGTVLGTTKDHIESYSNCNAKCVFANPTFVDKVFVGIEWQCVEFARRWLIKEKGLTFESIDVAADLWNKITHLVGVKTKEPKPLTKHVNGAATLPAEGDLLVYAREYQGTGHVAIVLSVNRAQKLIFLGEQNFENLPWKHDFARAISYVSRGGRYWLLDSYLLGWMSY